MVKISIGFILFSTKKVNINWPLVEATAPHNETIPKEVPLKGRGKIYVI
jgi:hypothetical protein